jgi:RNA polymerase sigma-70 factor, ECF subfamily
MKFPGGVRGAGDSGCVESATSAEGWSAIDDGGAAWSPTVEGGYHDLAGPVLGYFRSHRVDQAEDLLGEVFVSVARNLHRFRGDREDFRRWVFAIAHRRRVDHVRRWHRHRHVVATDVPHAPSVDRSVGLDVDLVAALAELTPLQREVILLRFVADLSLRDVARIVGRSTGAVKATQSRALTQLAKGLGRPAD